MIFDPPHRETEFPSAATLSGEELVSAAQYCCDCGSAAARLLARHLRRLVSAPHTWEKEAGRLDRRGVPARYLSGPLHEIMGIPANLIVLSAPGQRFRLLHKHGNRWSFISADGSPLPAALDMYREESAEAVVIRIAADAEAMLRPGGFASLSALWPELRAAWAEVGFASLFINAGQLLVPLFSMLVYDKIAQNGLFETLWALVIGMAIYLATDTGLRLVRNWATERISVDLARKGDETLWARLTDQTDLPGGGFPRFLSNYRDMTLSRDFVSSSYLLSIADIPFLLLYLVVIGVISWQLMLVNVLLMLLYTAGGLILQTRHSRLSREAENNGTRKLAFMGEALGSLDVLRTVPGSSAFLRRWRELSECSADSDTKRRLASGHQGILASTTYTVTTVTMLTAGVYLIHSQSLSYGKLVACTLLAGRAMGLVTSLFAVTGKWKDFTCAAARMEKSLEPVKARELTPRPQTAGNISVIGLGKQYEGRPPALENVSLTLSPGERVALLGRPGAGKTTLLRCIAGLCRGDEGQVLVDGLGLDDIARSDRARWLAYKSQDPELFAGTLEDNLRVASGGDENRFAQAIWASGLEDEVRCGRMSLGMHISERGGNLSGGQRQKVALARAFAQPARILLLDEPTLGLDPDGERLLAQRLPKLIDDRTVLVMTTHSAVMLGIAQRVIALDGGRVVADGPREKLLTIS